MFLYSYALAFTLVCCVRFLFCLFCLFCLDNRAMGHALAICLQLFHLHFLWHTFRLAAFNDFLKATLTVPHTLRRLRNEQQQLKQSRLLAPGSAPVCSSLLQSAPACSTACFACCLSPVEHSYVCLAAQLPLPWPLPMLLGINNTFV